MFILMFHSCVRKTEDVSLRWRPEPPFQGPADQHTSDRLCAAFSVLDKEIFRAVVPEGS